MFDETLKDIGEFRALQHLLRNLESRDDIKVGVGDDCAVISPEDGSSYDLLLTSDPVIAGIHFTMDDSAQAIGHKALGRVLSDIAAMGGEPLWALVDLVAPATTKILWLDQIYNGISELAKQNDIIIAGGDLSRGELVELHVFGIGRIPAGKALLRAGARAGDILFVTGALGGSLKQKHLNFQPRVKQGKWLSNGNWGSAMIDISDGLALDLKHLARQSKVGAIVMLESVPISGELLKKCERHTALQHAFSDGEDYELLFTVPPDKAKAMQIAWHETFDLQLTQIGVITGQAEILECIDKDGIKRDLSESGYNHFA